MYLKGPYLAHFPIMYSLMTCCRSKVIGPTCTIETYNYADDNTVICSGYEYEDVKAELMLNVDKII